MGGFQDDAFALACIPFIFFVCQTSRKEVFGRRKMSFSLRTLIYGFFVMVHAQPFQRVHDGLDGFRGRAFAVRIFYTDKELAPFVTGEEPVEYGCSYISNMHLAGRAWCESDSDAHGDTPICSG